MHNDNGSGLNDRKSRKINNFFSDCIKLDGVAEYHGSVRIDGQSRGKVKCNSTIFVGKYSKIDGQIATDSLYCEGSFQGDLAASEYIHLAKSGKLRAEVKTPDFTIEEGAFFEGHCTVIKPRQNQKALTRRIPRSPIQVLDT